MIPSEPKPWVEARRKEPTLSADEIERRLE